MKKQEITRILKEIATLLDLRGENPFKGQAYRNAARVLEGYEGDLDQAAADGRLDAIPGIGKALAEKMTRLLTTGSLPYLEGLRDSVPNGLLEIVRIPGLGARKARALYQGLGVSSLVELEYACCEGRVDSLEGFGRKSQEKILDGIRNLERVAGRYLLSEARKAGAAIADRMRRHPKVLKTNLAGSARRGRETVGKIVIVCSVHPSDREAVIEAFLEGSRPVEVLTRGEAKVSVRLAGGLPVDLRLVEDRQFAAHLVYLTGSRGHHAALRGVAERRGLRLDEYGLYRGEEPLPARTEEEIYRALGMPMIPPELREERGEIEAAGSAGLPDLIEPGDLRGLLHVHTTWSDGVATLPEMAAAARAAGYSYIGISDHSRSAFYARGLEEDRLRDQIREIDAVAREFPDIDIIRGAEVDILPDGRLDYPDDLLEALDYVVAGVHSSLEMAEEAQTERVLRGLQNPHVSILAHPSGRLLLIREPTRIDLPRVIREAAERGVALEINANPRRLDLDWRLLGAAKKAGARFCINPDAHSVETIGDVSYGVTIARKGWLGKDDVINTLPLHGFLERARRS